MNVRVWDGVLPEGLFVELRRGAMSWRGVAGGRLSYGLPVGWECRDLVGWAARVMGPLVGAEAWLAGVEWWFQYRPSGEGKVWHYDKDEARFEESGEVVHPRFSSVLYFGSEGGPTVVGDLRAPHTAGVAQGWAVAPRRNRLTVFAGDLYHCIAPGAGERITLVLNWWDRPLHPDSYQRLEDHGPLWEMLRTERTFDGASHAVAQPKAVRVLPSVVMRPEESFAASQE